MTGNETDSTPTVRRAFGAAIAFVAANRVRLVRDLIVATAWALALALAFVVLGWPRWAYYVALVAGAVGYTLATAPADRGGG